MKLLNDYVYVTKRKYFDIDKEDNIEIENEKIINTFDKLFNVVMFSLKDLIDFKSYNTDKDFLKDFVISELKEYYKAEIEDIYIDDEVLHQVKRIIFLYYDYDI